MRREGRKDKLKRARGIEREGEGERREKGHHHASHSNEREIQRADNVSGEGQGRAGGGAWGPEALTGNNVCQCGLPARRVHALLYWTNMRGQTSNDGGAGAGRLLQPRFRKLKCVRRTPQNFPGWHGWLIPFSAP